MIVIIDMHIRDDRLLQWLSDNIDATYDDIADHFSCHRTTAIRMIKRLERAGYIRVHRLPYRRAGNRYEVHHEQ